MPQTRQPTYLFYVLGSAIPLIMGVYWILYWFHPFAAPTVTRVAVSAVAASLALLLGGLRISRAEVHLVGVLGIVSVLYLSTAFVAIDVERSLNGWTKYLILFLISIFLSRALRSAAVAKGFAHALMSASLLIGIFLPLAYVRVMGWGVPTFEEARRYKGLALAHGLSVNAVASTAVLAYLIAMCLLRGNKLLWAAGIGLLGVSTCFTGSRAPLGVFLLTGLVLLIVNGLRSSGMGARIAAGLTLAAVVAAVPIGLKLTPTRTLSELTEGRWDLWYVAIQKFSERPVIGYGYDSTGDDLFARLPGWYAGTQKLEAQFHGDNRFPGGYHNLYLSVLVEQGLVGFIALATLLCFVIRSCWMLAFRNWQTWFNKQWALVVGVFMLAEGSIEVSGLLAKGSAPPDYLYYMFLAVVVSRFSIEEQCARAIVKETRFRFRPKPFAESTAALGGVNLGCETPSVGYL